MSGCRDDGSYNPSFWIPVASKKELVYRKKKKMVNIKKEEEEEEEEEEGTGTGICDYVRSN